MLDSASPDVLIVCTPSGESSGGADPMAIDYENHRRNVEAFLDARSSDDPYL